MEIISLRQLLNVIEKSCFMWVLILKRTSNSFISSESTQISYLPILLFSYSKKCRKYPAVANWTKIHSQSRYSNSCTILDRPWGFKEVEVPRFHKKWHMKVVRLLALGTDRLYPPGNIPDTHFCFFLFRSLKGHFQLQIHKNLSLNP